MQSYRTSQVGGRASQVGGIACIIKVNESNLEPFGMAEVLGNIVNNGICVGKLIPPFNIPTTSKNIILLSILPF